MSAITIFDPTDVKTRLGAPIGVARREFAVDFATGNLYYTDANTGNWILISVGSGGFGPGGSTILDFGVIVDGAVNELAFTLTGAVIGQNLAPAWPATLDVGLVGMMFISAANTITVRLINLSGAPIDPGPLTYGARVIL